MIKRALSMGKSVQDCDWFEQIDLLLTVVASQEFGIERDGPSRRGFNCGIWVSNDRRL
jgi:hypothetical protein